MGNGVLYDTGVTYSWGTDGLDNGLSSSLISLPPPPSTTPRPRSIYGQSHGLPVCEVSRFHSVRSTPIQSQKMVFRQP